MRKISQGQSTRKVASKEMSEKSVGMLSSYKNLSHQQDWLWKQTPHPFGLWGNVQMLATAKQPDFLLLYQFDFFPSPPPPPWWKIWQRKGKQSPVDMVAQLRRVPKEHIIYLLREPPLPEIINKNRSNYQAASQYCGHVFGPDNSAPIPDYMPAIWYISNSFRELDEMPIPQKIRPCSWITSGIARTETHRQRLAFLKLLQENGIDFDLYGRSLPDWVQGGGRLNNKWHGMAPYYYNLAIENYGDNEWYVSEKLWDALLAWCLPIYYGGSAADKLLPPGSFLRLPSLDEKGMAYIREVIGNQDAWQEAKQAIAEARKVILHKLNLLSWLSDFVGNLKI